MVIRARGYSVRTVDELEELSIIRKRVAARMKQFRLSSGRTVEDLNKLMTLGNRSAWQRVEYNKTTNLNIIPLVRIACIMGISVSELLSPLPEELSSTNS